jgi:hypothetical protein
MVPVGEVVQVFPFKLLLHDFLGPQVFKPPVVKDFLDGLCILVLGGITRGEGGVGQVGFSLLSVKVC